jgi:hypothetical protein
MKMKKDKFPHVQSKVAVFKNNYQFGLVKNNNQLNLVDGHLQVDGRFSRGQMNKQTKGSFVSDASKYDLNPFKLSPSEKNSSKGVDSAAGDILMKVENNLGNEKEDDELFERAESGDENENDEFKPKKRDSRQTLVNEDASKF